MENKNEIREKGVLLRFVGGILTLLWAFYFPWSNPLAFPLGMACFGVFYYGNRLVKSQEGKPSVNPQEDSNHQ